MLFFHSFAFFCTNKQQHKNFLPSHSLLSLLLVHSEKKKDMSATRKSNDDDGGTRNTNSPLQIRGQMASMTLDDDDDDDEKMVRKLRKEITFKFRVKFYTKWGENVVVCGKSQAMGEYDATKGAWMSCEHIV